MLPNGKGLLFSAQGGVTDDEVYVESLQTHERRAWSKGFAPHYLPTGHLAFVQGGTLFAVRFDAERFERRRARHAARGHPPGALGSAAHQLFGHRIDRVHADERTRIERARLGGPLRRRAASRRVGPSRTRSRACRRTDGVSSHRCAATPKICG